MLPLTTLTTQISPPFFTITHSARVSLLPPDALQAFSIAKKSFQTVLIVYTFW